jgi:hypothetical protein
MRARTEDRAHRGPAPRRRQGCAVRQRPPYTGELVKIKTLIGLGAAVLIVLVAVLVANAVIGLVVEQAFGVRS